MAKTNPIHQDRVKAREIVEALIRAGVLPWIRTLDPWRVKKYLKTVAENTNRVLRVWSPLLGVPVWTNAPPPCVPAAYVRATATPLQALVWAVEQTERELVALPAFHLHMTDPHVVAGLLDASERVCVQHAALVVLAAIDPPVELRNACLVVPWPDGMDAEDAERALRTSRTALHEKGATLPPLTSQERARILALIRECGHSGRVGDALAYSIARVGRMDPVLIAKTLRGKVQ
jgi:hypothetical protein